MRNDELLLVLDNCGCRARIWTTWQSVVRAVPRPRRPNARLIRARGVEADILRLAGIYGPGRNALVNLRQGQARRIVKPGQVFNRAHVDDIAELTRLALTCGLEGQIYNVADDEPAPPQDVVAYAAALLGLEPRPEKPFSKALPMAMTAKLYDDNKRGWVANCKALRVITQAYPI